MTKETTNSKKQKAQNSGELCAFFCPETSGLVVKKTIPFSLVLLFSFCQKYL